MFSRIALLGLAIVCGVCGACGDDPARVELVPVNPCGAAASKTALRVIAYTAGGEVRRTVPPLEIDAFPADTEQLGVEVIGNGGALVAIGKTAPLDFASLADGASIPVAMAPPDGFCPVGPLGEPRVAPLVARAGRGVLVAGGLGTTGERLSSAEFYDPATATFTPVQVPPSLVDADNGLAGAVLTELPDGRVALSGTASHALAIFDADDRRFSTPSLFDQRAYHGALAPDAEHLFVIGGCADVVAGACSGPALRSSFTYELDDPQQRTAGPQLGATAQRYGAQIFDLGIQRDGVQRYLLAGGAGDPGVADRFALTDVASEPIAGLYAHHTLLDGGAVLTAFDPDAAAQTGVAGVLVPGGGVAPIALAPRVDGMRLATLEDGSVIAIGPSFARFVPTTSTWPAVAPAGMPPAVFAPVLVRLADGSVLVLGGRDASAEAWLFRPSLVGPQSGSITVLPDGSTEGVLTAPDPTALDRTGARFALVATDDDYRARALVGGPRIAEGSITAVVRAQAGGVALLAQQTGPGRAIVGRLVPGEPARIERLAGGTTTTLCTGSVVDAGELVAAIGLAITGGSATLTIGASGATTVKATCAVPTSERGAWGIAAAGPGARIEVGPVTVARTR